MYKEVHGRTHIGEDMSYSVNNIILQSMPEDVGEDGRVWIKTLPSKQTRTSNVHVLLVGL